MEIECQTKYGKFYVMKNDFIGQQMAKGQHFEQDSVDILITKIRPGDVVVDVGAHIGTYTIPFAKAVGPTGKVHSFEPQSRMRELLKKNVEANGYQDRVVIHSEAVGHKNCETTMNANDDVNKKLDYEKDGTSNFGGMNLGKDGEKVKMVQLDKVFLPRVNLIKIDVEGAEKLVLYGAREIIEAYKPYVFYEKNYKKVTKEMIEMFNLSKNLINFDIKDFFIKELNYYHLENTGFNYLAVPMSEVSSDYQKVREFTESAAQCDDEGNPIKPLPNTPQLMNRQEVEFVVKMVLSEMQELVDTVTESSEESLSLMHSWLGVDQSKHESKGKTEVELIADQADAAVDAWVYLLNAFCKKGVDLSKVFDLVHQANMAKRDPKTGRFIRRESDGKILKPEGWTPPNLVEEIKRQGRKETK